MNKELKLLEKILRIHLPHQWYKISPTQLKGNLNSTSAISLDSTQENNLINVLKISYPSYKWNEWDYLSLDREYWNSFQNQFFFLEAASEKMKIKYVTDWYRIPVSNTRKHAINLFKVYTSFLDIITTLYPSEIWFPWNFYSLPTDFWNSIDNQRFFTSKEILKDKDLNYWYQVPEEFAISLFRKKYDSIIELCQTLHPEQIWLPWKFKTKLPSNFFISNSHQKRNYFVEITKDINLKTQKEWYISKVSDLSKIENNNNWINYILEKQYQSNLMLCITDIFPEVYWLPWKFNRVTSFFWENKYHQKLFLNYCEKKLEIKNIIDWKYVSFDQILKLGGFGLLKKYDGILKLLFNFFPGAFSIVNKEEDSKSQKNVYVIEKINDN